MRSREGTNVKIVSIRVIVGLDVFKWPCRVFYCVNEVTTTEVPMQSLTPANPVSIVDVDHGADKVTSSLPFFPEDVHSFPSVFLHRCRLNNFLDTLLTVWVLICYWLKKKNCWMFTSNIVSPDSRLRAANSKIMVPAQAVQVSDSVPVRESGLTTP